MRRNGAGQIDLIRNEFGNYNRTERRTVRLGSIFSRFKSNLELEPWLGFICSCVSPNSSNLDGTVALHLLHI